MLGPLTTPSLGFIHCNEAETHTGDAQDLRGGQEEALGDGQSGPVHSAHPGLHAGCQEEVRRVLQAANTGAVQLLD